MRGGNSKCRISGTEWFKTIHKKGKICRFFQITVFAMRHFESHPIRKGRM